VRVVNGAMAVCLLALCGCGAVYVDSGIPEPFPPALRAYLEATPRPAREQVVRWLGEPALEFADGRLLVFVAAYITEKQILPAPGVNPQWTQRVLLVEIDAAGRVAGHDLVTGQDLRDERCTTIGYCVGHNSNSQWFWYTLEPDAAGDSGPASPAEARIRALIRQLVIYDRPDPATSRRRDAIPPDHCELTIYKSGVDAVGVRVTVGDEDPGRALPADGYLQRTVPAGRLPARVDWVTGISGVFSQSVSRKEETFEVVCPPGERVYVALEFESPGGTLFTAAEFSKEATWTKRSVTAEEAAAALSTRRRLLN